MIKDIFTKLFFNKDAKNIFAHEADGEPCVVCGKPMQTNQGVTKVRSGEKMHSGCWSVFFEKRIEALKTKYGAAKE